MQAIATLLKHESDATTTKMWHDLELSCKLSGMKFPRNPHFSWMVAEKFEEQAVKDAFAVISKESAEFEISTNGLGLFTSEKPILYIPIVKTEKLLELHQTVWNLLLPLGENPSSFYQPSQWIPHVTLTSDGLSASKLSCILEEIIHLSFVMTIPVNNLALIFSDEKSAGIKFVQEFERGNP